MVHAYGTCNTEELVGVYVVDARSTIRIGLDKESASRRQKTHGAIDTRWQAKERDRSIAKRVLIDLLQSRAVLEKDLTQAGDMRKTPVQ
jgi:hypothetical protein